MITWCFVPLEIDSVSQSILEIKSYPFHPLASLQQKICKSSIPSSIFYAHFGKPMTSCRINMKILFFFPLCQKYIVEGVAQGDLWCRRHWHFHWISLSNCQNMERMSYDISILMAYILVPLCSDCDRPHQSWWTTNHRMSSSWNSLTFVHTLALFAQRLQ